MGHSRAEGHEVEGRTTPFDTPILTNDITAGSIPGIGTFALGHIIGSLQGDLLLSVTFPDGERVNERLDMGSLLAGWIGEIAHSKRMRDDFPVVDGRVVERDQ